MPCVASVTSSVTIVFLAALWLDVTSAATCPYPGPNCQCTNTTVTCSNLQVLPPLQTGSDVIPVVKLEIDDGNLTSILDNSLPPGLVELTSSENPLTNVSDNAFAGSASTLTTISITDAGFRRLPRAFIKLTSLTNFTLMFTNIDVWDADVTQALGQSVRYLFLQDVNLTSWPSAWLSSFGELYYLNIDVDLITAIPDNAFATMANSLLDFSFHGGALTQIPKCLRALNHLTTLDLSSNTIADENGRPGIEQLTTFPCAQSITYLDIGNTGLSVLPNLASLSSLTTLDLSLNMIALIDLTLLPPNLLVLDLNQNNVAVITDSTFPTASQLQQLNLAYNPITSISPSAFQHLPNLQSLDLTMTRLTEIPRAVLSLKKLTWFDLAGLSSLQCPCPTPPEWLRWYSASQGRLKVYGSCCDTTDLKPYLKDGSCHRQPYTNISTTCPQGNTALSPCYNPMSVWCLALSVLFAMVYSGLFY